MSACAKVTSGTSGRDGSESPPEVSIVIPCYNEEENIEAICAAVACHASDHVASLEILLIDNGSSDKSRELIRGICARDARVRAIFNTRNFGQMRSPTHGIYQASGDAVIGMCADFQDPPAMIGELVRHWRTGVPIVLGQRRNEKVPVLLRTVRALAYFLLSRFADYQAIPHVTGFGLYDRRVIDVLAAWNEPEPFFRGMLVESGFAITLLPFDRPERQVGKTKNNFGTLLGFALSSLATSSRGMLRWPLLWAPFVGLGALALLVAAVVALFVDGASLALLLAGFALMIGMFAILFFFLGLLGVQTVTIAERSRGMPLVVEEERINFPVPAIPASAVRPLPKTPRK